MRELETMMTTWAYLYIVLVFVELFFVCCCLADEYINCITHEIIELLNAVFAYKIRTYVQSTQD